MTVSHVGTHDDFPHMDRATPGLLDFAASEIVQKYSAREQNKAKETTVHRRKHKKMKTKHTLLSSALSDSYHPHPLGRRCRSELPQELVEKSHGLAGGAHPVGWHPLVSVFPQQFPSGQGVPDDGQIRKDEEKSQNAFQAF